MQLAQLKKSHQKYSNVQNGIAKTLIIFYHKRIK